jgi:putative ABC transport system permease protein
MERSSSMPFPAAEALVTEYPGMVENAVRFFNMQRSVHSLQYINEAGTKVSVNEYDLFFADSTVFDIFDFNLIRGNKEDALREPFSAVITESTSRRYFGSSNPIGKIIRFEDDTDLTVTGVTQDVPANSHFRYNVLVSMTSLNKSKAFWSPDKDWGWNPCWTYVLLSERTRAEDLQAKLPAFVNKYYSQRRSELTTLYLQPLTDIHLHSHRDFEIELNSNINLIYIIGLIAFIILASAGINFINLSTARALSRAKEVGIRKVVGAERKQLLWQFLTESIIISIVAIVVALPFVYILLPVMNNIILKEISLLLFSDAGLWGAVFFIIIFIGFIGGIYPAVFVSSFQPVKIISGKLDKLGNSISLRKMLVVVQFTISTFLIIGTIITFNQLDYLRSVNVGYNKDHVIVIPVKRTSLASKFDQYRNQILMNKNIVSVSASSLLLGTEMNTNTYIIEGKDHKEIIPTYNVRKGFLETMGLKVIEGRGFDENFYSFEIDSVDEAVVNEAFVKHAGWDSFEEAIGKRIDRVSWGELYIIGVVKNFHYNTLRQPIQPFIMNVYSHEGGRKFHTNFVYVRALPFHLTETIEFLKEKYTELESVRPFDYFFLDEKINSLYSDEEILAKLVLIFSIMAIVISSMGLLGLTIFSTQQRTKEIGIRKIVGASVIDLVTLISKQFIFLILIANLIAFPLAYYFMNLWLHNFVLRIQLGWQYFVLGSLFTLIIAFSTFSFQVIKATLANPVKTLKYE